MTRQIQIHNTYTQIQTLLDLVVAAEQGESFKVQQAFTYARTLPLQTLALQWLLFAIGNEWMIERLRWGNPRLWIIGEHLVDEINESIIVYRRISSLAGRELLCPVFL